MKKKGHHLDPPTPSHTHIIYSQTNKKNAFHFRQLNHIFPKDQIEFLPF